MSYSTDEIRHAVRHAAEGSAAICIGQAETIDVFEREAAALFAPGVTRGEASHRGMRRMGLHLDDAASTPHTLHFRIERSQVYGALVVHFESSRCTGYTLARLEL
jgi:hypothetical protein